jgi:hypothetical protein
VQGPAGVLSKDSVLPHSAQSHGTPDLPSSYSATLNSSDRASFMMYSQVFGVQSRYQDTLPSHHADGGGSLITFYGARATSAGAATLQSASSAARTFQGAARSIGDSIKAKGYFNAESGKAKPYRS